MIYIFKILIYILLLVATYVLMTRRFIAHIHFNISGVSRAYNDKGEQKTSFAAITIIAVFWGLYSIWASATPYSGDRLSYVYQFVYQHIKSSSTALGFIMNILRRYTLDPNVLFFLITFLSVVFILLAYRQIGSHDKDFAFFIVTSNLLMFSFYLLKQAPAVSIGSLGIVLLLQKKYAPSIVCVILSILFHESALILIPIYIFIVGRNRKSIRVLSYFVMLICILAFSSFSQVFLARLFSLIPGLSIEASTYLDATGSIVRDSSIIAFLKGAPIYIITAVSIAERRKFSAVIEDYPVYMVIGCLGSVCWFLSTYMYWLFRFALFCYIPMFYFAGRLVKEMNSNGKIFKYAVGGSFLVITVRYLYQMYFLYGGF